MTPAFARNMKQVIGTDVGLHYPGPIPFTPLSVRVINATDHQVGVCLVSDGFAQQRSTGRPAKKHRVVAATGGAVLTNGRWVASRLSAATFSCSGVTVPEPRWSS